MAFSPLVVAALEFRKALRDEFQDLLEALYQQAETETNGNMLNRRGHAEGVDPFTLLYGPWVRVDAFASEEYRDWLERSGRMTFDDFERQRAAEIFPDY